MAPRQINPQIPSVSSSTSSNPQSLGPQREVLHPLPMRTKSHLKSPTYWATNVLITVTAFAVFVIVRLPVTSTAGFMLNSARVGPPLPTWYSSYFKPAPQDLPILVPCWMQSTHVFMTFRWSPERERERERENFRNPPTLNGLCRLRH